MQVQKEGEKYWSKVQHTQHSTLLEPALGTPGKQHITAQHWQIQHLSSTPYCADAGAAFTIYLCRIAEQIQLAWARALPARLHPFAELATWM